MKYDMSQSLNSFSYLSKYIPDNSKVLDFGSGKGYIAGLIAKNITPNVICTDVIDIKDNPLPLVIYDGKKLPFTDKQFDVSICLFVLHHTVDQVNLLKELSRVTKKRIIVMEDLSETVVDKFFALIHKITSYVRYNSTNMLFRKDSDWCRFYKKMHLNIEAAENISMFRNILYPIHRKMYVLNPIKD